MEFHDFYLDKWYLCTILAKVLFNYKTKPTKKIMSTRYEMGHNVVRQQKGNKKTQQQSSQTRSG